MVGPTDKQGYFRCDKLHAEIRTLTCAKMHMSKGWRRDELGSYVWSDSLFACAQCKIGRDHAKQHNLLVPAKPDHPAGEPARKHSKGGFTPNPGPRPTVRIPTRPHRNARSKSYGNTSGYDFANRKWLRRARDLGFGSEKEMWECLFRDCYSRPQWAKYFKVTVPTITNRAVKCGLPRRDKPTGGARTRVIHIAKFKCPNCNDWHEITYYVRAAKIIVVRSQDHPASASPSS